MSVDRAIELQEQSWNLQAEGRLGEASLACSEALQLMEESEGPESPDVANLLNDLAEIDHDRQNFQAALSWAERAQSIEDKLADRFTGEDAARIRTRTLALAGAIRRTQGDYARAECDLLKAFEISGAEFGEASEEAAQAQNDLGVLYKYWGRFDDGMRLYRRALASMIALHGDESLACAGVYHNIGGILHTQGAYAAAEEPGRKAWEISRRLLGEGDPRTMRDAVAYAGILDGLGKYEESEPIYRKALLVFEKAFGSGHYDVAMTLQNLAGVLAARGDHSGAEPLYRRALMTQEKLLGNSHPDVALLRNNLGRLLTDTGRSDEAVPLLENAVAILERQLLPGHPLLVLARKNLRKSQQSCRARSVAQ